MAASMRTLAPCASASSFKNRNLITIEDCQSVFRVIWDGVMNQSNEPKKDHKYDLTKYMRYN